MCAWGCVRACLYASYSSRCVFGCMCTFFEANIFAWHWYTSKWNKQTEKATVTNLIFDFRFSLPENLDYSPAEKYEEFNMKKMSTCHTKKAFVRN